jgi:hypothetical protein
MEHLNPYPQPQLRTRLRRPTEMSTRLWTKRETQQTLRSLRKAGYIVSNDEGMYTVTMPGDDSEKSYLTATIGTGSFTHYLVRYEPSLFEENA